MEIQEKVPVKQSSKSGEPFRALDIKNCVTIGWDGGLDRLFRS